MLFSTMVNANSCVILLYHHISDSTPKSTSVSPLLFEQHLQYLQDNNFKVLKLKKMLRHLDNNDLPNKCVVLTADDAYQSIAKNAYPLLKKYQMPMSVFVSTTPIDKKYIAMMTWQQMRDIQGNIMQFYNHTTTHPYLLNMDKTQIKTQITQAQNRLNQELNQSDKIFAYPYGEANFDIFKQVKDLNYTALSQHSGVVSKISNRQNMPRFPMAAGYAQMSNFKTKVNALPMLIKAKNINPVFTKNPPTLALEFSQPLSEYQKSQFLCFSNGGVNMTWQGNKIVKIIAKKPLTKRRSKYNCTMPSRQKGKYHWHSVQWINPKI